MPSSLAPESMLLTVTHHNNQFGFGQSCCRYKGAWDESPPSSSRALQYDLVDVEQKKCTRLWESRMRSLPRVGFWKGNLKEMMTRT